MYESPAGGTRSEVHYTKLKIHKIEIYAKRGVAQVNCALV